MYLELWNATGNRHIVEDTRWKFALALAVEEGGWLPQGTQRASSWDDSILPWDGDFWAGGYTTRAAQFVTAEDARSFAAALEDAATAEEFAASLDPCRFAGLEQQLSRLVPDLPPLRRMTEADVIEWRNDLLRLSGFARGGAFSIE